MLGGLWLEFGFGFGFLVLSVSLEGVWAYTCL